MARLRPDQFAAALRQPLVPLYLVSGDEPLLVQEACDSLRAAARQAGFSERTIYQGDSHFDWGHLLAAASNLSLFSDKKLIELRLPSGKPGDKGAKALQEYAQAAGPDNLLLMITPKLDAATLKSKWVKVFEDTGIHLQIWPVTPAQLPRWIQQRLQQAGLHADSSAVELLAARVEGNLLAAAQEVEKLKLLARDNTVSYELTASVVADSARYDVFGLTDKALYGDARGAVKTLQGLKAEGTDAINVLWAVTRDVRSLVQISLAVSQGKSFEAAARQAGVWEKRQPLIQAALRRGKPAQWQQLLRKANGIDKAIKGMRSAEPWDELLDLVLNLAGVYSLTPTNERLNLKL